MVEILMTYMDDPFARTAVSMPSYQLLLAAGCRSRRTVRHSNLGEPAALSNSSRTKDSRDSVMSLCADRHAALYAVRSDDERLREYLHSSRLLWRFASAAAADSQRLSFFPHRLIRERSGATRSSAALRSLSSCSAISSGSSDGLMNEAEPRSRFWKVFTSRRLRSR